MIPYNRELSLCFDDILLVPQRGDVNSRKSVNLSMGVGVDHRPDAILKLNVPIIAAPMDTVVDVRVAREVAGLGGLAILHRYNSKEQRISDCKELRGYVYGVSVSTSEAEDTKFIKSLLKNLPYIICIDTANGHSASLNKAVSKLRNFVGESVHIMAGNVATRRGFVDLVDSGADSVRVGIGGGSACTTRIVSGHGVPTLGSIIDCAIESEYLGAIVADGGIRNSGDAVKAFAAGASAVMLGGLLAGHTESPGFSGGEQIAFRGMASASAQNDWRGYFDVAEGAEGVVQYRGDLKDTFKNIKLGLGSGCSYSGCNSLSQLHFNSEYVRVSSQSLSESNPRI
jgi:IMP dehydrogenase